MAGRYWKLYIEQEVLLQFILCLFIVLIHRVTCGELSSISSYFPVKENKLQFALSVSTHDVIKRKLHRRCDIRRSVDHSSVGFDCFLTRLMKLLSKSRTYMCQGITFNWPHQVTVTLCIKLNDCCLPSKSVTKTNFSAQTKNWIRHWMFVAILFWFYHYLEAWNICW